MMRRTMLKKRFIEALLCDYEMVGNTALLSIDVVTSVDRGRFDQIEWRRKVEGQVVLIMSVLCAKVDSGCFARKAANREFCLMEGYGLGYFVSFRTGLFFFRYIMRLCFGALPVLLTRMLPGFSSVALTTSRCDQLGDGE